MVFEAQVEKQTTDLLRYLSTNYADYTDSVRTQINADGHR
jgi:hypothetical protein